jgi:hypothetical protein
MGKKMIGQKDGQYFLPNHFFAENCSLRTLGFLSFALRRAAAKEIPESKHDDRRLALCSGR